jgi:hypothetical protein
MKKSWIVLLVALLGMLILMISCSDSEKTQYSEGQELTLSGTIKIVDNDGTYYVLVTDKNEFFEIPNIIDEYKEEGVPIKAVLKIKKPRTLTGLGPSCEVLEYLE